MDIDLNERYSLSIEVSYYRLQRLINLLNIFLVKK